MPIEAISGKIQSEPLNRNFSHLDSQKASVGDLPFVNIMDYGAIGDGVADDTAIIQAQLDKALNGGIRVVIPAGTYRLTAPLNIYENTVLHLHSDAIIDNKHNGTLLKNIEPDSTDTGYDGNGNIIIEGGTWDMNAPTYTGGTAFVFGHGENLIFRNLTILDVNPGHAMEINACKNVMVDNCKFRGMVSGTSKDYSEAIQLDLMKSSGVFPWKNGNFDNTPCQDVTVQNCTFEASETNGPWGRAVGGHSATANVWHERITIKNNTVWNCNHWAFRAYSWNDVNISDNRIYNCGGGISLDPNDVDGVDDTDATGTPTGTSNQIERFTIRGNIIKGGGSYGSAMSITGDQYHHLLQATVTENKIIDYTGGYSIYAAYVSESNIANNVIRGANTAIKLSDTWMVNVEGNMLRTVEETGIEVFTGNQQTNITGNSLYYVRKHGIWISGTDTTSVTNNQLAGIGYVSYGTDWNGVRVTTEADRVAVVGNTFRNWGTDYQMANAVNLSSTVTNSMVASNNMALITNSIPTGVTASGNLSA